MQTLGLVRISKNTKSTVSKTEGNEQKSMHGSPFSGVGHRSRLIINLYKLLLTVINFYKLLAETNPNSSMMD